MKRVWEVRDALTNVVETAGHAGEVEAEAQAAALFETTAETATGLMQAIDHFETGAEPAWRHTGQ